MFSEREKAIYTSPVGKKYDPLRLDRLLVIQTNNRLGEFLKLVDPKTINSGDVSKAGRAQAEVEACNAELELARASRAVFELPEFPDCTDAWALETLYHFLEWLEGKGETAGTPQSTPVTDFESRQGVMGTSSLSG